MSCNLTDEHRKNGSMCRSFECRACRDFFQHNREKNFGTELKELLNKHSIENQCDMPDFILAGMIIEFIKAVGPKIKQNLDWHGCGSVCHPLKTDRTTQP